VTPSLRKLKKLVATWIVTGTLLLIAGAFFILAFPPIVRILATAALVLGGILLLCGLIGKVAALALQSADERGHVLRADTPESRLAVGPEGTAL
jgi:cytochrome bd-type quinol oxidase subunit 2